MTTVFARIDALALDALALELALERKPGLVTPTARGSHDDMDHASFIASIGALRGYFGDCARLAAQGGAFEALRTRGRLAEASMFAATAGVNTHKGAVFTLGLLSAAAGWQHQASGAVRVEALGGIVAARWGAEILAAGEIVPNGHAAPPPTHGTRVRQALGLPGAREQAASGFPVLFETTYPELVATLRRGATPEPAALHALLATIARLPDTNLAHRGGLAGLAWAQAQASAFVTRGSVFAADGRFALATLGRAFVARWLSPGGSADLLAAAWLLWHLDHQFGRPSASCASPVAHLEAVPA